MLTKQTLNAVTWIDAVSPTQEEVRGLMEEYDIDPLVGEALLLPSAKARVDVYEDFIYLILHFPALRHTHRGTREANQEVDCIIGKDFLITVHYDTVDPIHKFSKAFEVETMLEKNVIVEHAGFVFFFLIRKLYRSLVHELEAMADALSDAQERIFAGEEKEMVVELSKISRDLLIFKQALSMHREVLESFGAAGSALFGASFQHHLRAIVGEYQRVGDLLQHNRDTLAELRETNMALVSTKQNEVMKIFTIMAFVTFPLSLLAAIFGMGAASTPLIATPYGFWVIVGIMAVVILTFFSFFRYKKWL